MANGDNSTRADTAPDSWRTSGGETGEQRSPARVPRARGTLDSAAPPGTDQPSTDEFETIADVADPQPSVLPPDVAAARTAMHRRTMEIPIVVPSRDFGEDDEADPIVAGDPEDAPDPGHRPHVVVERRTGLWVTISLLVVLLIGTSTLSAYLWHVADEWEAQVEELTDVSYGLGDDLASERESLIAAEDRIDLLTDQLATSKDSVSRLQAENARWGDDAAFAQEQITRLQDLVTTGNAATGSLTRCIEAHQQLITYLEAPDTYAPEEIEAFKVSVTELCTEADLAGQEFRKAASE